MGINTLFEEFYIDPIAYTGGEMESGPNVVTEGCVGTKSTY